MSVLALLFSGFATTAHAQTTTVTAAWDRNTDAQTTGYLVYYGTSPGNYQWTYDAGNQVTAGLTLTQGAVYYVAVRAYNASAQVGPPSNEATINLGTTPPPAPTAQITATLQTATSALVTWQTTNAVSATINGTAVATSGTTTVPVSATTTFTLVATSASGATATRSATVTVTPPAAPTATITAVLQNPTTALVTWQTTNAVSARINGATVGLSGSSSVPISATTTFTLVATSASGATATRSATVTVTAPAAPTATINAVLQNPTTALLTWSTTNAVSARINGAAVATSGTSTVPVSVTTTFTLVATSASGATATRSATVTIAPAPPAAPTAQIAAVLQNPTTALLTWQTTNAASAKINGATVAISGTSTVPVSATTTFTLVATSASGATATQSATVTVTPPPSTVPSVPTNMAAAVLVSRATLSWRAPASGGAVTKYLLYMGTSPGGANIVNGVVVGNVLSVSGDLPKGRYYARVRAANDSGLGAPSNEVYFKVGRSLLSPRGFTVQWQGTTAVLSWSATASDGAVEDRPTAYVLEAGTAPGAADIASVSVGNVTTFQANIPSGTYYVRVRAVNDYGDSDPSEELVLAAPGAPAAPLSLRSAIVGSNLELLWTPAPGPAATAYVIEAGTAPGQSDLGAFQVGNVTRFAVPAPPAGTYYVRVRAINGRGPSAPSNELVVRR